MTAFYGKMVNVVCFLSLHIVASISVDILYKAVCMHACLKNFEMAMTDSN